MGRGHLLSAARAGGASPPRGARDCTTDPPLWAALPGDPQLTRSGLGAPGPEEPSALPGPRGANRPHSPWAALPENE